MVLDKSIYNTPDYWEGALTGIRLDWGYGNYLETLQNNVTTENDLIPLNGAFKRLWEKIQDQNFTNAKVLEIGGATGYLSKIAKHYFPLIQYDVLDISTYWTVTKPNIEPTVDNYFNVDVIDKAQETGQNAFKNNEYDVIISHLFLECLSDAELAIVIPKLNNWARVKQVHFFNDPTFINQPSIDNNAYNFKTLQDWAQMGFESGTILNDRAGNSLVV